MIFPTSLLMLIKLTNNYPCYFIIYTDYYSVLLIVLDYCSYFLLSAIKLGEFAEVFKGLYDGSTVAVKILKVRYNESFVGGY